MGAFTRFIDIELLNKKYNIPIKLVAYSREMNK